LPNLILIRVQENLSLKFPGSRKTVSLNSSVPVRSTHDIVSHQFGKFFQCYAMAFNEHHNRVGTLFQTPFKRALIDEEQYLLQLVYFIHANPQIAWTN
jgi:hypothetical protein